MWWLVNILYLFLGYKCNVWIFVIRTSCPFKNKMYPFILNSSNKFGMKRLTLHFPSLIQARHGKSGKWGRPRPLHSDNSGSSNGSGSSTGGFGNFDDGFDGSKPRASSELLFFSTGKNFASYPLDHQIPNPHNKMKEVLNTLMKPTEVYQTHLLSTLSYF